MLAVECTKISCAFCREIRLIEQVLGIQIRSTNGKMSVVQGNRHIGCSLNAVRAMCYFCKMQDCLVTKAEIEDYVWQGGIVGMSSLPVLMHEVRRLIAASPYEIVTLRNKGFVFHNARNKRLIDRRPIVMLQPSAS
ncbi:winged helix-turn-helix domain-containing protein [Vibrio coralliilyticus]|uniref:winged helix-turn-helix domain-containing protein n=1 Tax=Vibrio coralliilyticus TaxID=190893 RepID=UPI000BAACF9E|nr:winged helix-turn-helix domain-containing protein [Vibrio coralliilyticus]NOI60741.1 CadC family transcriptional regulator [Vibrio coralliilyticus]PAT66800.1 CadC family transcriptional regulator [Vibrio coralliilyticus]